MKRLKRVIGYLGLFGKAPKPLKEWFKKELEEDIPTKFWYREIRKMREGSPDASIFDLNEAVINLWHQLPASDRQNMLREIRSMPKQDESER